jgi:membrane-associated phospholipid phosphatase
MKADWQEKFLKFDADTTRRLRIAEKPGILRDLAAVLAHSGDSWFLILGLVLLWGFGTPEWKRIAVIFLVSILILAAIVFAIKFSVRRKRPEGDWGQIYRLTDPHSFPSGHAARAALLSVLAIALGPTWFGLVFVIWAPLVILARVAMGVHYFSDVVAGAVLGVVCALTELFII